MKNFTKFKLNLLNIGIILIIIILLYLTIQFFIKKQKMEHFNKKCPNFKGEKECSCKNPEECEKCEEENNNNDKNDKVMTPYGYKKKKEIDYNSKQTCTNDNKEKSKKCIPTNNDVNCGKIKDDSVVNNQICKFSSNDDEPKGNDEDVANLHNIDMDKYILKSKLKILNLQDKNSCQLKSQYKSSSLSPTPPPTQSNTEFTSPPTEFTSPPTEFTSPPTEFTSPPTETTNFPEEDTITTSSVIEQPSVTLPPQPQPTPKIQSSEDFKNDTSDSGASTSDSGASTSDSGASTSDSGASTSDSGANKGDNNNIINQEQLNQITKELKDIKNAMFKHDKKCEKDDKGKDETSNTRKPPKDYNLMDDTHPFYNCYDKRRNPYTTFKQYESSKKDKKRKKFTDTPYKIFF